MATNQLIQQEHAGCSGQHFSRFGQLILAGWKAWVCWCEHRQEVIPLSFPMTDTDADKPEEQTEDDKKLPGLQRGAGRSWGVTAALPRVSAPNLRGLWLKKWFIGAGWRGPLSNLSHEWDFSWGRGRVNQTPGCREKARKASAVQFGD